MVSEVVRKGGEVWPMHVVVVISVVMTEWTSLDFIVGVKREEEPEKA
jgi:hypothetical protein